MNLKSESPENQSEEESQKPPEGEGKQQPPEGEENQQPVAAATPEKPDSPQEERDEDQQSSAGDSAAGDKAEGASPGETPGGPTSTTAAEAYATEMERAKDQSQQNWDKYMRLQAEFENYKKRIHKEQSDILKYAQMPLLREIVGILENLERAVDHAKKNPSQDQEALISGIEMVIKQLVDTFDRFGMTKIEAQGLPFDPTRHEAMGVKETNDVPENQVVEEYQTGYILHDRVVRPAMVVVSKRSEGNGKEKGETDSDSTKN